LAEEIRILTFPSVWHAFRAEKLLNSAGLPCTLIPVPRELSSSCQGLAAKINESDLQQILSLLDSGRVLLEKRGVTIPGLK
jgi:hypothetical protein